MTYGQPHPDAPPVLMNWHIENDTVLLYDTPFSHASLPNHAQFRVVTPPSDLIINPDLDGYHWRIITWEVIEMPDPRTGIPYKYVKIPRGGEYRMTDDEIARFKAHVGYEAVVREAIEARQKGYQVIGEAKP